MRSSCGCRRTCVDAMRQACPGRRSGRPAPGARSGSSREVHAHEVDAGDCSALVPCLRLVGERRGPEDRGERSVSAPIATSPIPFTATPSLPCGPAKSDTGRFGFCEQGVTERVSIRFERDPAGRGQPERPQGDAGERFANDPVGDQGRDVRRPMAVGSTSTTSRPTRSSGARPRGRPTGGRRRSSLPARACRCRVRRRGRGRRRRR